MNSFLYITQLKMFIFMKNFKKNLKVWVFVVTKISNFINLKLLFGYQFIKYNYNAHVNFFGIGYGYLRVWCIHTFCVAVLRLFSPYFIFYKKMYILLLLV